MGFWRQVLAVVCGALLSFAGAASIETPVYRKALDQSYRFYEAQRSGKLPASNRIPWRGDSFLTDCDGVMARGYFDAGDHLKLLFPLSTSLAFIGLSTTTFEDAINATGTLKRARETVRWGSDFLMAAHVAPAKFIGQVGDPGPDHAYWGRPEEWKGSRPCYVWDLEKQPASDLASAASSALTAAHLVFRNADPTYATTVLGHAKELYALAKAKQGKYSDAYPKVTYVYTSNSFRDDLAFAAAMLWKATNDTAFLNDAIAFRKAGDFGPNSFVSWDSVGVLSGILLECGGRAPREAKDHVQRFLNDWQRCNGNGFAKTPKGMCVAPLGGWGNLRYSTSAAFASVLYASCESNATKRADAVLFAKSQVDYALGSSGRSFVVGIGKNYPKRPHHRAASCPSKPAPCSWNEYNSPNPNPQILYGALVGGPKGPGDAYVDDRADYQQNEVAVDFNAGYTGALAGLLDLIVPPAADVVQDVVQDTVQTAVEDIVQGIVDDLANNITQGIATDLASGNTTAAPQTKPRVICIRL